VGVPLALGSLQLSHPTWTDGAVSQAVADAGAWWIPLHVLLMLGYVLLALTLTLWPVDVVGTVGLAAFVVSNTAFLAVDGVVVGTLAATNPPAADAVWNSPLTIGLGDVTGAPWCAALLSVGVRASSGVRASLRGSSKEATHNPPSREMPWLAILIWLAFVASLVTPAAILVGSLALVVAVYRTYLGRGPRAGVTFGLFALAALARQHVGVEAALGMLWIALASVADVVRGQPATGRSGPAASSPPESG
jgi:hypothetical protein